MLAMSLYCHLSLVFAVCVGTTHAKELIPGVKESMYDSTLLQNPSPLPPEAVESKALNISAQNVQKRDGRGNYRDRPDEHNLMLKLEAGDEARKARLQARLQETKEEIPHPPLKGIDKDGALAKVYDLDLPKHIVDILVTDLYKTTADYWKGDLSKLPTKAIMEDQPPGGNPIPNGIWDVTTPPRFSIEQIIKELLLKVDYPEGIGEIRYAEYWHQHVKIVGFHYDKDEGNRTHLIHPDLSTITYLTGVGSPTLIFNQTRRNYDTLNTPVTPREGILSFPSMGTHLKFDPAAFHGVPGTFTSRRGEPRLGDARKGDVSRGRFTFLVNYWKVKPSTNNGATGTYRQNFIDALGFHVFNETELATLRSRPVLQDVESKRLMPQSIESLQTPTKAFSIHHAFPCLAYNIQMPVQFPSHKDVFSFKLQFPHVSLHQTFEKKPRIQYNGGAQEADNCIRMFTCTPVQVVGIYNSKRQGKELENAFLSVQNMFHEQRPLNLLHSQILTFALLSSATDLGKSKVDLFKYTDIKNNPIVTVSFYNNDTITEIFESSGTFMPLPTKRFLLVFNRNNRKSSGKLSKKEQKHQKKLVGARNNREKIGIKEVHGSMTSETILKFVDDAVAEVFVEELRVGNSELYTSGYFSSFQRNEVTGGGAEAGERGDDLKNSARTREDL